MIYLDTSAAIPMFVPEPTSQAIDQWFETCHEPLASSDWILTEFSSALSIKVRRGEINEKQATAAWASFDTFCGSGLRLLPVTRRVFQQAARLARNIPSGLRSGDSLHLAMALEVTATSIATVDNNLAKNAKANGLVVNQF
jgi:predicted nucleic acid-binding protein